MSQEYIVQIYSEPGRMIQSQVWNDQDLLGLGHPLRWVLEKNETGLLIRNLEDSFAHPISLEGGTNHLTRVGQSLLLGIYPTRRTQFDRPWNSIQIPPESAKLEEYTHIFSRSLATAVGILVTIFAISALIARITQPADEALIPAQFAKVILAPTQATPSRASQSRKVLSDLRSSEVAKATQSLIQGGVLGALASSRLPTQTNTRALSKQLYGGSKNSIQLGSNATQPQTLQTALARLGGSGQGNSLNYSQVQAQNGGSQGRSFVSLETLDSKVDEGLTQEEVGKVIHSHLAEVRYCYESSLLKASTIQGKLVIDFTIQTSGGVRTAKVNQSSIDESSLGACLIKRLMEWKFPKPKGGIEVAVSYPFIFKTLGK